jgi:FixJ family two-component response regulator
MAGQSGLEFQRELAASGDDIPIIFITAYGDIAMSVRAMKAGAVEFLTKPFRDQDLLDAIHVGFKRSRAQRRALAAIGDIERLYRTLTPREKETMAMVVSGLRAKEIAVKLKVSEITVKVRRSHIMRKMHADSLPDLSEDGREAQVDRSTGNTGRCGGDNWWTGDLLNAAKPSGPGKN